MDKKGLVYGSQVYRKGSPRNLWINKPTKVLGVLVPNWKGSGLNQQVTPTAGSRGNKRDRRSGEWPPSPLMSELERGGSLCYPKAH